MANDPYSELGVSRTAGQEDIRKAFRKLAKKHHPDANPGDAAAEERFKRVSGAFDIVGDPDKRKKFDAGEIDASGSPRAPGFNPRGGPGGGGFHPGAGAGFGGGAQFEGADINDILGEMFGGARQRGRGFGGFGGFGAGPERGGDLRAKLDIDLEEAINGGRRRLAFSDGRTLEVSIPKGAQDGQTLRLKGQGAPGTRGAPAGDALIEIAIRPHTLFRREGDDLVMDLAVPLVDAILGGKVQAQTPEGPVALTIPKHSSSGRILRLKGRGMPQPSGARGDLLARLMIQLPDPIEGDWERLADRMRKAKL